MQCNNTTQISNRLLYINNRNLYMSEYNDQNGIRMTVYRSVINYARAELDALLMSFRIRTIIQYVDDVISHIESFVNHGHFGDAFKISTDGNVTTVYANNGVYVAVLENNGLVIQWLEYTQPYFMQSYTQNTIEYPNGSNFTIAEYDSYDYKITKDITNGISMIKQRDSSGNIEKTITYRENTHEIIAFRASNVGEVLNSKNGVRVDIKIPNIGHFILTDVTVGMKLDTMHTGTIILYEVYHETTPDGTDIELCVIVKKTSDGYMRECYDQFDHVLRITLDNNFSQTGVPTKDGIPDPSIMGYCDRISNLLAQMFK